MRHQTIRVTGRSAIKPNAMSRRRRTLTQLVGVFTVLSVLGLPAAPAALASESFTVDTVDDFPDLVTADGVCLTAVGTCSLRAAIMEANSTTEPANIGFDIPGSGPHVILVGGLGRLSKPAGLNTDLPPVVSPATIDATTEPDYRGAPVVEIQPDASFFPLSTALMLDEGAAGSIVRGLAVNFFYAAIHVDADGALVEANYLGISPDHPFQAEGDSGYGNLLGVWVSAEDVVIGGPNATQQNVISNNEWDGILADSEADQLVIENNLIGTDPSGSQPSGNGLSGVYLWGPTNTRVTRNVVSGNEDGIVLDEAEFSEIAGNLIGTDITGLIAIGNKNRGISIEVYGASDSDIETPSGHQIGGPADSDRNVVAGNGTDGVGLVDSSGVRVENNYIGLNAAAEPVGNLDDGFWCSNCSDVDVIGNVISDNGDEGIHLRQDRDFLASNTFQGNLVGTDPAGEPVSGFGNAGTGVQLEGASGNLFGGTTQDGNIVAQSGEGGVVIHEHFLADGSLVPAVANTVTGNEILQNEGPGIDLGNDGVTVNDADDVDEGANLLQNHADLSRVFTHGNSTRIEGSLDSAPGTYAVELFVSGQCDPSGFGEGAAPFTSFDVTISQTGEAFSLVLHDQLPAGGVVTGTATDGSGNTSEFSACAMVDAPGNPAKSPDPSAQQPTSTDSEPASEDEDGGSERPSGR